MLTAAAVPSTTLTQPLTFTYSLTQLTVLRRARARRQSNFPFAIDPNTGEVTITGPIDFETAPQFNVTITALGPGNVPVASVNVTIDITAVPCPAGSFSATGTFPCNATSTCPDGFVVQTAATATTDTVCSEIGAGSSSGGGGDDGATAGIAVGVLLLLLLLLLLIGAVFRKRRQQESAKGEGELPPGSVHTLQQVSPTAVAAASDRDQATLEHGAAHAPKKGRGRGRVDEYTPQFGAEPERALLKGGDDGEAAYFMARRTSVNPTYDTAAQRGAAAAASGPDYDVAAQRNGGGGNGGPDYDTAWSKTACLKPGKGGPALYDAAAAGQDEGDVMYDVATGNQSPYRTKSYDTALNTVADGPDYDVAASGTANAGASGPDYDVAAQGSGAARHATAPDYDVASGGAAASAQSQPDYDVATGREAGGAPDYDHAQNVRGGGTGSRGPGERTAGQATYDLGSTPAGQGQGGVADYATAVEFRGAGAAAAPQPHYDVGNNNARTGETLRPEPAYDLGVASPGGTIHRPEPNYDNEMDEIDPSAPPPQPRAGATLSADPQYELAGGDRTMGSDNEFLAGENGVRIASVRRQNPLYRNSAIVGTAPATITEEEAA